MASEPGIVDGEILEEMKRLELMIAFHKKANLKGLEPNMFYPNEIAGHLNAELAAVSWDNANYDTVRSTYAAAWISHYTRTFDVETFYTSDEFAAIFKTD